MEADKVHGVNTNQIKTWISEWQRGGDFVELQGHRVFFSDTNRADLPVMAVLHGYPSSSFDYKHVLRDWSSEYRVILHDHLGFGLSAKPKNYSYSLLDQAQIAIELWMSKGLDKINLIAHDYGTSVCTEILALREEGKLPLEINSVTLCNGSIHIELAKLRWIQHLLLNKWTGPWVSRWGSEAVYVHQMRRLWADRSKCHTDELRALYRMNVQGGGKRVLHQITQYLNERYCYWDRWIGALTRLDIPTHVLWAQEDPVAVKAIGEALHDEIPNSRITRIPGLGHYPMLEDPARWGDVVVDFIHDQK